MINARLLINSHPPSHLLLALSLLRQQQNIFRAKSEAILKGESYTFFPLYRSFAVVIEAKSIAIAREKERSCIVCTLFHSCVCTAQIQLFSLARSATVHRDARPADNEGLSHVSVCVCVNHEGIANCEKSEV
jgi:hypothetical protein